MGYQQVIYPNFLLKTVSIKRSEQSAQGFSQSGLENLQGLDENTSKNNLINSKLCDNVWLPIQRSQEFKYWLILLLYFRWAFSL